MHVLVIPSWYPKDPSDIQGSFFREQALAIASSKKCKVGVIYPNLISLKNLFKTTTNTARGFSFEEDERLATLRFTEYNFLSKFPALSGLRWKSLGMRLFEQYILIHGKPDLLHAHSMLYGAVLASEISKKHNIPFIITEHASGYSLGKYSSKQLRQAHLAAKNALRCLAVSDRLAKDLQQTFQDSDIQWEVVPNIISATFQRADLKKRMTNQPKFVFLTVSFLTKNKSIDTLIRAFSIASQDNKNLVLKIGGCGSERSHLEKLSQELGISDQVIFLGKLRRKEVRREMLNANVFTLASQYESFGVVVIEAMACGLPVIATRCGGPESLINNDNGRLVTTGDELAFASAMHDVCKNYDTFSPQLIRDQCLSSYSEKVIVDRLTEIYQESIATQKTEQMNSST